MTPPREADGLSQLTELLRTEPAVEQRPLRPPVDPERSRRVRRRVGLAVLLVVVLGIGSGVGYVAYALNAPVGAATSASTAPEVVAPSAAAIALPADGATAISVAGAEQYLGPDAAGIWMSSGGDDPRPIASISKLITAMVVLAHEPLAGPDDPGPTLTFDKADHDLYDKYYLLNATIAPMRTGSTMTQHDALETMLVASASNYAEAVADWAFGSQAAYRGATRDWLAAHGMTRTTIVEPTGLDGRNTSTPSDLIALAKLAAADPVIAQIAAMPNLTIPDYPSMPNTNDLLGRAGITGLKTGTLDGSGSNLLFTATVPVGTEAPLSVVGVILGGPSHAAVNDAVQALLASLVAGFHEVPVAVEDQEVGTFTTAWGESAGMVLADDASMFTWSDTPVTSSIRTTGLTTGEAGEQVGTVTFTAGDDSVTVPVVLESGIAPPSEWWRLTHPGELGPVDIGPFRIGAEQGGSAG